MAAQTFRSESAMLAPVTAYLQDAGCTYTDSEVQFFEFSMDVYGYAQTCRSTTAIELKLRKWNRAFEQALIYQLCADFVYIALPAKVAKHVDMELLAAHGLGLLSVDPAGPCTVLLEAVQSEVIQENYRDFYVKLMETQRHAAQATRNCIAARIAR